MTDCELLLIHTLVLSWVLREAIFAWADSSSCLSRRIYKTIP